MTRREGHVAEGFEPVARAFEASFEGRPGMGAALAVLHRGELVVDLHGGSADRHGRTPWTDRTLSVIFSCTKGVLSILVARLVQEGRLDYDAPAIRYWPEFGEAGKSDLTVGDLLAHRAGLSAPRQDLSVDDIVDWDRMVSILARQEPLWAPGTGWAYHAITHGWLGGELVRRVTGRSVGDRFREAVAEPLGVDMWIGLPADRHDRVATMWSGPSLDELTATQQRERGFPGHEWLWRAMTLGGALPPELVGDGVGFNDPRIHSAEIPGAGGSPTRAPSPRSGQPPSRRPTGCACSTTRPWTSRSSPARREPRCSMRRPRGRVGAQDSSWTPRRAGISPTRASAMTGPGVRWPSPTASTRSDSRSSRIRWRPTTTAGRASSMPCGSA
ncbi:hypothetical protein GCM10025881_17800 [Pseudolysinimonas kribbensis]|uniref:Beta-lactamase-related domain-containing protein n=1 Tax=Pseudolysinimonas kribbensis TaxID=433641 RepID=A0ABQ6K881_9MICO|nr:hypothetical protein GCM10025881_17800 [Pseudolysinimonas kribbensis]